MHRYQGFRWQPYVPVAERRRQAEREMAKLREKGHPVSPVVVVGRQIAGTFWGKAWCQNMERYSDFSNRLPRGRTYVRNGSVVDLQIGSGEVNARVRGSSLYSVKVSVAPVPKSRWKALCGDCAGAIASLVELLQGRFSKGVMERICAAKTGLFPAPSEIHFSCSCPDWAYMCKHVAAVLYGIGSRLDEKPELLFKLRQVDVKDLLVDASHGALLGKARPGKAKTLAGEGLSELFGIELEHESELLVRGKTRTGVQKALGARRETPPTAAAPKKKSGTKKKVVKTASSAKPAPAGSKPKAPRRGPYKGNPQPKKAGLLKRNPPVKKKASAKPKPTRKSS